MGWSFRKSLSLGGLFRLNLSKGGVGVSVGVKGARVSLDPKGRATVTVGRGGLYARKNLGHVTRSRKGPSGTGVGLAIGSVVVVLVVFVLLWPSPPKTNISAPPSASVQPAETVKFDAMDEAAKQQKIWKPGDPVTLPKPRAETTPEHDTASSVSTEVGSKSAAPVVDPWPVREGRAGYTLDANGKPSHSVDVPTATELQMRQRGTSTSGKVWVPPYRKKDGTMVEGYWRDR